MKSLINGIGGGFGRVFGRLFAYIIIGLAIYYIINYLGFDLSTFIPNIWRFIL